MCDISFGFISSKQRPFSEFFYLKACKEKILLQNGLCLKKFDEIKPNKISHI